MNSWEKQMYTFKTTRQQRNLHFYHLLSSCGSERPLLCASRLKQTHRGQGGFRIWASQLSWAS